MVKKHQIALFLDTTPAGAARTWMRVKKSTTIDIAMNPELKDYDYIADESPTTELDKYKPSIDQALTMYEGEPDYQFIFDKFFNMATGDDAKTNVLIVFYQESLDEADTHTVFKAWESDCVISINDLNGNDSVINFDVNFGGTVKKGYATIANQAPTFTEGTYSAT